MKLAVFALIALSLVATASSSSYYFSYSDGRGSYAYYSSGSGYGNSDCWGCSDGTYYSGSSYYSSGSGYYTGCNNCYGGYPIAYAPIAYGSGNNYDYYRPYYSPSYDANYQAVSAYDDRYYGNGGYAGYYSYGPRYYTGVCRGYWC